MALKKAVIGAKVYIADNDERLLFTKGEFDKARKRYIREVAKRVAQKVNE